MFKGRKKKEHKAGRRRIETGEKGGAREKERHVIKGSGIRIAVLYSLSLSPMFLL